MKSYDIKTLDEMVGLLRGRPGLVYGSLATLHSNSFELIVDDSVSKLQSAKDVSVDNLSTMIDSLRACDPATAVVLESEIKKGLDSVQENDDVEYLVKAGWSMCISLTRDMKFEIHLQNYSDSLPNSRPITIVDHPSVIPHTRAVPIYKLVGNLRNREMGHSLVLAESDLLVRKTTWRLLLNNCSDYLLGNPILFVGTNNENMLVQELLSILITLSPPAPKSLIFLKGDPLLENPTVIKLCETFSSVFVVDATIRDISRVIRSLKPKQQLLNLYDKDVGLEEKLQAYQNIISIVK